MVRLKNRVVAVVPTLNEEEGLPRVLEGLKRQAVDEIVVVDGNSTDRTAAIARASGARVILQDGRGKGNGFKSFLAKFPLRDEDFYVMLDGDASYDPADLPKVVARLREGCDVVAGARRFYTKAARDFVHNIGNHAISLAARLLFWHAAPDVCTGYWGFRGGALRKMNITAERFDLEADLFSQACRRGLRFEFVPVSYRPRLGEGKLSARDGWMILKRLLKGRFS